MFWKIREVNEDENKNRPDSKAHYNPCYQFLKNIFYCACFISLKPYDTNF